MIKIKPPSNFNVSHVTYIQATVVILLSIINGIYGGFSSCLGSDKTDCAANSVLAVILVIVTAIWFAFLAAMAYTAWVRRTTFVILLFIILELIVAAGIFVINLRHPDSTLGFITSLIDLTITLWVLYMSYFLFKLRGTSSAPLTGRKRSKLNQQSRK